MNCSQWLVPLVLSLACFLDGPNFEAPPKNLKVTWAAGTLDKAKVDRVVIHSTAALKLDDGKTAATTADQFFDLTRILKIWSEGEVGPHYVIDRNGKITKLVNEDRQASHATIYNSRSIGIELVGMNDEAVVDEALKSLDKAEIDKLKAFTESQYTALDSLLRDIKGRYPKVKAILHSEILDEGTVKGGKSVTLMKAPGGGPATPPTIVTDGTIVHLADRKVIVQSEVWYEVHTLEKRKVDQKRGWLAASAIVKRKRKHDPGGTFKADKITAVSFTDDDM